MPSGLAVDWLIVSGSKVEVVALTVVTFAVVTLSVVTISVVAFSVVACSVVKFSFVTFTVKFSVGTILFVTVLVVTVSVVTISVVSLIVVSIAVVVSADVSSGFTNFSGSKASLPRALVTPLGLLRSTIMISTGLLASNKDSFWAFEISRQDDFSPRPGPSKVCLFI